VPEWVGWRWRCLREELVLRWVLFSLTWYERLREISHHRFVERSTAVRLTYLIFAVWKWLMGVDMGDAPCAQRWFQQNGLESLRAIPEDVDATKQVSSTRFQTGHADPYIVKALTSVQQRSGCILCPQLSGSRASFPRTRNLVACRPIIAKIAYLVLGQRC
jgi:hypothetical protein